jgi:hypothetical protein
VDALGDNEIEVDGDTDALGEAVADGDPEVESDGDNDTLTDGDGLGEGLPGST